MKDIVETAREKAIGALSACVTKNGLYASCGRHGYTSVWARDSMISLISATSHTELFKTVFTNSLSTLAKHQSPLGQIPNDVDLFDPVEGKKVTFATIDSSLWFVLGEYFYAKKFGKKLWTRHSKNIGKAMKWLAYQDAGEDMMPEQQPTTDWQDCFPHKYGHTINTQALYYAALKATGSKSLGEFRRQVDKYLWDDKLGYYLPWHWKDHDAYSEKEEWFDSLGNMLAIVFGLASKKQAKRILSFVEDKRVAEPFPMRVIHPPITRGSAGWRNYFEACLASEKHSYLNGGIWPFVGGFYVCALVEAGQFGLAAEALQSLAKADSLAKNKKDTWDFNEWIHPVTRKASGGRFQSWSSGAYLLAYESVKRGKNPIKI